MSDRKLPRLSKWPFVVGDLVLVAGAAWVASRHSGPLGLWASLVCLAAVALGAWFCILPFLREYEAELNLAEARTLADAVAQIKNLENIRSHIVDATGLWSAVQGQAEKTAQNAREVADQVAAQLTEFKAFFQKAGDQEKNTLRLEVEKLRRAEGEWLQVLVRILDFVHSLHQAGLRTGQKELIHELTQFQNACRETARRIGLVPLAPTVGELFDAKLHQLPDGQSAGSGGARIKEVMATGFTYQAQLLRRALVKIAPAEAAGEPSIATTTASLGGA